MKAQLRDQQRISRRKKQDKRKTENNNLKYYDCTLITERIRVHSIRYYISIKIKPWANSHNIDKALHLTQKHKWHNIGIHTRHIAEMHPQ